MNVKKIIIISAIIIIIAVAIIVAVNFLQKKQTAEKNARELKTGVDTTGMNDYLVYFPFQYQQKIGEYYDSIIDTGYSFVDERVINDAMGNQIIVFRIKALPKQAQNISNILSKQNKEIIVKQTNKTI